MAVDNELDLNLTQLKYWCQTVLPAVFDDSLSYYELLAKVVDKLNEGLSSTSKLVGIVAQNKEDIAELQELFKKFMESGFDDYYRDQIEQWFKDNAFNIYKLIAKQVFFGLTDDGYFCAYVPDSWKEITFDTGANYGTYTYGRLILRYEADGSGVIDNTSYGEYGAVELYEDLKSSIEKLNETVYTALSAKG